MLGKRKPTSTTAATASEPTPEPAEQQLAEAEAALNALLSEQTEVRETLAEHQRQRQEILHADADLAQIVELDRSDYQLNSA